MVQATNTGKGKNISVLKKKDPGKRESVITYIIANLEMLSKLIELASSPVGRARLTLPLLTVEPA